MLNIAVCDDEENTRKKIVGILQNITNKDETQIYKYSSGEDLLYDLENNKCFDIVLLDLSMDGIDGIQTAERIRKNIICSRCIIMFITSYTADIVKVVDVNPFAYIYKNKLEQELSEKVIKAIRRLGEGRYLKVMSNRNDVIISYNDIIYIEAILGVLEIHTTTEVIRTRSTTIKNLEAEIDKNYMIKCHQSFIVNSSYIKRITPTEILMYDNSKIPVSRKYKNEILNMVL